MAKSAITHLRVSEKFPFVGVYLPGACPLPPMSFIHRSGSPQGAPLQRFSDCLGFEWLTAPYSNLLARGL